MITTSKELIRKYNVPGPRYTSYPTVPFWDSDGISRAQWRHDVVKSFVDTNPTEGISIYIHLPFCESLCTFCGCHKRITKRHEVEEPYIDTLLAEWKLYKDLLKYPPKIHELHLGGGTPTFFSPNNLKKLMDGILEGCDLTSHYEFSFEGHPNNTTRAHLQTLYDLGFRRCSFGVQDYDPEVQRVINRIQPLENVRRVTEVAREIGYTSVSHDLVFGLPKQTLKGVLENIRITGELKPDRIAFYSYAHVPWIKGLGQRGYDEKDLPEDEVKRELYEQGKMMLMEMGYEEIGMDHFALTTDSLHVAMRNGKLHRNFMGYTSGKTQLMIGLGMSSISDSWYSFAQNEKSVEDYEARVHRGELPVFRGHSLTVEDLLIRKHILNLMCRFHTSWSGEENLPEVFAQLPQSLKTMIDDGLVVLEKESLTVTPQGIPFVRNVCMTLDARMIAGDVSKRMFSKTV
jgi:oxygen-independent coproporphyrinogen-3 oxidase